MQRCQLSGKTHLTSKHDCKYGLDVDDCGNKYCMKGPGDYCGGLNNIYGTCAEGLACSDCNRCRGCSIKTLTCHEDNCLRMLYRYIAKQG